MDPRTFSREISALDGVIFNKKRENHYENIVVHPPSRRSPTRAPCCVTSVVRASFPDVWVRKGRRASIQGWLRVSSSPPRKTTNELQTPAPLLQISPPNPTHLPLGRSRSLSDRPRGFRGVFGGFCGGSRWRNVDLGSSPIEPKDIRRLPVLSMKRLA
ncbi:hypothetical protein GW17_00037019 [Ensete ventricosum]|nr:hypothetical protein GW17_00037019 [Ensete ventricosum]RZS26606.1 hypothetical protein BHM03_00059965 [Ensete ventricosum]